MGVIPISGFLESSPGSADTADAFVPQDRAGEVGACLLHEILYPVLVRHPGDIEMESPVVWIFVVNVVEGVDVSDHGSERRPCIVLEGDDTALILLDRRWRWGVRTRET